LLDFRQAKFFYSNYGHPSQYIYRVTESHVLALGSQTSLLGLPLREEAVYEHNIAFNKGDMILLFTDGVIETRNAEGEEYGEERLERFIAKNHALSVNDFNQHLMDELNAYKYRDFKDDISVLSMRIKR
jgi:sigma-B regulation protein RsbU (phosphoserine phosphatase)